MITPVRLGLFVALVVLIADQISKWRVLDYFLPMGTGAGAYIEVTPFLNIVLVWNTGVSFGMFSNLAWVGPWLLSGLALAITIALVIWLWRTDERWNAIALGLTIGGACGNIIDRLRFHAVVDFVDVHAYGWHWPAFNVADAAITIGVGLLIIGSLLARPSGTTLEPR